MNMAELTGIGGAAIGDLEIEISKMDKEIRYLTQELKRTERFKNEAEKYRQLWRDHLDAAPIEEENDQEAEARQLDWNASDAEKLIKAQAEGYDKSDRDYIPF